MCSSDLGILVIGLGMTFIVEPVMGGINTGLNSFLAGMGSTSRVLLGFILAAMMAIDMGGHSIKQHMFSELLPLQQVIMI